MRNRAMVVLAAPWSGPGASQTSPSTGQRRQVGCRGQGLLLGQPQGITLGIKQAPTLKLKLQITVSAHLKLHISRSPQLHHLICQVGLP